MTKTRSVPPEIAEQMTAQFLRLGKVTPDTPLFFEARYWHRANFFFFGALPMVERGYAYTGVDVSEAMMNQLRQKVAGKPHRLTLLKADATALPLEANQFDVAIAAHILHLIPAWQQALGEIHRVLKPDGVLIYFHHSTNKAGVSDVVSHQWRQIFARLWVPVSIYRGGDGGCAGLSHPTGGCAGDGDHCRNSPHQNRWGRCCKPIRTASTAICGGCQMISIPLPWGILRTWAMERFESLEVEIESRYTVTLTAAPRLG